MQSVVSSCCSQLMVDMGSVCGRYYKPVVVACCCTSVQQCSVGLDEQAGPDELVIATNTSAVQSHQITNSAIEKNLSGQLQVQDEDNYSCCSSNVNKIVLFPSDDGSYKDESFKFGQRNCLIADEVMQQNQTTLKDYDFIVNCVAVQETYRYQ